MTCRVQVTIDEVVVFNAKFQIDKFYVAHGLVLATREVLKAWFVHGEDDDSFPLYERSESFQDRHQVLVVGRKLISLRRWNEEISEIPNGLFNGKGDGAMDRFKHAVITRASLSIERFLEQRLGLKEFVLLIYGRILHEIICGILNENRIDFVDQS